MRNDTSPPALLRSVGPFQLAFYALGSMLGSGIYGLVGKAAGAAGTAVWLSFIVALVAALLTAMSYASLGSRYPKAGGAAYAAHRAFHSHLLSFTVGLALVCSGLTSVATQSRIFAANLTALFGIESLPTEALALGFVLIMAGIVFRGIRESMWVNILCTLIEASGLLIVIAAGMSFWGSTDYFTLPADRAEDGLTIVVVQASILTFFAFIGFEDAINIAEECRDPQRTIPIGLIAATGIAAILYTAIAITVVSVVPPAELAAAPSPLTEVMQRAAPGFPAWMMTGIALFSVANTALVNYITGTRLVYGMSNQGLLPSAFGAVHESRRTPHFATLALFVVLVPLVLTGTITDLASATVLLLLLVFVVVNLSLFTLIRRKGEAPGKFEVPLIVPALGALVCTLLLLVRITLSADWVAPALAATLIGGILLLYAVHRPKANDHTDEGTDISH